MDKGKPILPYQYCDQCLSREKEIDQLRVENVDLTRRMESMKHRIAKLEAAARARSM